MSRGREPACLESEARLRPSLSRTKRETDYFSKGLSDVLRAVSNLRALHPF
jgi:hypothetical protein